MLGIVTKLPAVFRFFEQHKKAGVKEPTKQKDKERREECNT